METTKPPTASTETPLAEFVDRLVAELEPLQLQYNEAVWAANLTGEARYEAESAALDARIRSIFARTEPYRFLVATAKDGQISDPLLRRQLTLLVNDHRAHQISPEMIERIVKVEKALESRFNTFRAELDGEKVSDNKIRDVLRDSNDTPERRRAWEASKQVGNEVVSDLLGLVALRNQAATSLGFDNYYSMMLELDELNEAELFALLEKVERGTLPVFQAYKRDLDQDLSKRFGVAVDALAPWHYSDPFFQEAPAGDVQLDPYFEGKSLEELTERFYSALGFEIGDLLARADLYEKSGKSQHAFCMSVDRAGDIRVLCNVRSNEYWMGTMLHEFGHAVYDKYIDRSLPYLLRSPAHTLSTEASAMLFGRLSKNAAWLTTYAGVPEREAQGVAQALAKATRCSLLVQTRWCLVMSHMERALYKDPGQDLNTLWWDLAERFQGLRRPEGRHAPDWASKIHFSVAPVYYHNYTMGEIMASQLQSFIRREILGGGPDVDDRYVTSPEVGAYLKQRLYRSGKTMNWRETLERSTGETLSPDAFVAELAARS